MGCCGDSRCCCPCCGKRGATVAFSLLGLLLASAVITPPVYIYKTDQEYSKMFPILKFGREHLARLVSDHNNNAAKTEITKVIEVKDSETTEVGDDIMDEKQKHAQTYELAIFQLLDDIEAKAPQLALFSFCMGCINVPLYLMLLTGATFKKSFFLVPWLVMALVEHLVIGVPLIVFFGLISLYLASQLQLYIWSGILIGSVVFAFLVSLSSWFTVLRCYHFFKRAGHYDHSGFGTSTDGQLTQPLLAGGPTPPPLPPNHPNAQAGPSSQYQLGQYPQYYPPHGNTRALPSAPPSGPGGIYPSLSNA